MFKNIPRLILLFFLGLFITALVSSCNSTTSNFSTKANSTLTTENCRPIKHEMGETCVPINPERIVVLDAVVLEDVLALQEKPIGSPLHIHSPLQPYIEDIIEDITDIGNEGEISLEEVVALQPDLIVGIAYNVQTYFQLSQIAPTVLLKSDHSGDWKGIFSSVADVLGKSEQAEKTMANYYQRIEEFKEKMNTGAGISKQSESNAPEISVVRLYPDMITLFTKPGFIGRILADAGLPRPPSQDLNLEETKQLMRGSTIQYSVSKEVFDKADGDAVFVIVGDWDDKIQDVLTSLKSDPLWLRLNAVQQGKVYEVEDYWTGSGPIAANAVVDDLIKYLVNTP